MFDLRYHVASLAAVFLALIIGILVGVGIASQTTVEESERRLLEQQIADLRNDLEAAQSQSDLLRRQQGAGTEYVDESYAAVMNGRLRGVRVAMLFVGPTNDELEGAVTRTLNDAGGPPVARMRALELPIDAPAVLDAVGSEDVTTLEDLGRGLGREFIAGGETPLWDAVAPLIVEDSEGSNASEADAVVVAHTARLDHAPTGRLVSSLYSGLAAGGVPVVGIESTDARPTRIGVYDTAGLSSVDSVDTQLGRIALAALLAGAEEGQYGLKSTADAAVPPIEPLPLAPLPGG